MDEEEARADEVVEEQVRRREEKIAMMKLHYREQGLGRYQPPPAPAWMRGEEPPPWRRERHLSCTSREAVERFDEDLKMRTLTWWHAIDLRKTAVHRGESTTRVPAGFIHFYILYTTFNSGQRFALAG